MDTHSLSIHLPFIVQFWSTMCVRECVRTLDTTYCYTHWIWFNTLLWLYYMQIELPSNEKMNDGNILEFVYVFIHVCFIKIIINVVKYTVYQPPAPPPPPSPALSLSYLTKQQNIISKTGPRETDISYAFDKNVKINNPAKYYTANALLSSLSRTFFGSKMTAYFVLTSAASYCCCFCCCCCLLLCFW